MSQKRKALFFFFTLLHQQKDEKSERLGSCLESYNWDDDGISGDLEEDEIIAGKYDVDFPNEESEKLFNLLKELCNKMDEIHDANETGVFDIVVRSIFSAGIEAGIDIKNRFPNISKE